MGMESAARSWRDWDPARSSQASLSLAGSFPGTVEQRGGCLLGVQVAPTLELWWDWVGAVFTHPGKPASSEQLGGVTVRGRDPARRGPGDLWGQLCGGGSRGHCRMLASLGPTHVMPIVPLPRDNQDCLLGAKRPRVGGLLLVRTLGIGKY